MCTKDRSHSQNCWHLAVVNNKHGCHANLLTHLESDIFVKRNVSENRDEFKRNYEKLLSLKSHCKIFSHVVIYKVPLQEVTFKI